MPEQLTLFPGSTQPSQYVYVLWRPNQFKVGMAADPARRARELGGRIVLLLPGGRELERQLHARFAPYRFPQTEWFSAGRAIWEWLADHGVDLRLCA
jgi:hypothetical protein